MNNNRMISIHCSTYHGKNNSRIRKSNVVETLNDNKKQKVEETTTDATIEMINGNSTNHVSSNNDDILKSMNRLAHEILKNNIQPDGKPSESFEKTIYFDNDGIHPSSQIEFDITIGSSVGDDGTVEIINNDTTNNDNSIEIGNNDETTVTENSFNYNNDISNANNTIIIDRSLQLIY